MQGEEEGVLVLDVFPLLPPHPPLLILYLAHISPPSPPSETMQGEEGGVLVLDVRDELTTRGRRVPGGVLPSVPRWSEDNKGMTGRGGYPNFIRLQP